MIKAILSDFSRVLLLPKDESFQGGLNALNKTLAKNSVSNLWDHFVLNEELLNFLDSIKGKLNLYIFTTGSVQNEPPIKKRLNPVFRDIFSVEDILLSKKDPKSYLYISEKIHTLAEEILFFDDTLSNIKAAQEAGLKVIHYQSNKQLFESFKEYLQ